MNRESPDRRESLRVLMLCPRLPTDDNPGSMAPALRQFQSLRDAGVDLRCIDMTGPRIVKYGLRVPQVRRAARSVDLVHAHYGFCGLLARCQLSRPIVMSFLGSDINGFHDENGRIPFGAKLEIWTNRYITSRLVSKIIVMSPEMAAKLAPLPVEIISNGIDVDAFCPRDRRAARTELNWDPHKTYVLFPANPDNPHKGFSLAQQVVRLASQQLGRDIELAPLWGYAPDQVPTVMNASDLVLMTSQKEGSPNVVKEAMACNVPVVCSPVGDVPDLLADLPGNRVCPRDAAAMATAVAELLQSGEPSAGRQRLIDRNLTLAGVAQRIIDVYRSVLETNRLPSRS
ncbi:MAG: glycosyltransferase [Planctomycetota bacterium]|nr:MAG: glycosyltransferase [Planctomycetota bacterium]